MRLLRRRTILIFLLALAACAGPAGFDWPREPLTEAERDALFAGVGPAATGTYGLTAGDAVRVGHYGPYKGIQAAREMIARLRKDGRPLAVVSRTSDRAEAPDPSVAQPAPYGVPEGGTIVDIYLVSAEGTADTLRLYFDVYHAAPVRVPAGLEWSEAP